MHTVCSAQSAKRSHQDLDCRDPRRKPINKKVSSVKNKKVISIKKEIVAPLLPVRTTVTLVLLSECTIATITVLTISTIISKSYCSYHYD